MLISTQHLMPPPPAPDPSVIDLTKEPAMATLPEGTYDVLLRQIYKTPNIYDRCKIGVAVCSRRDGR